MQVNSHRPATAKGQTGGELEPYFVTIPIATVVNTTMEEFRTDVSPLLSLRVRQPAYYS